MGASPQSIHLLFVDDEPGLAEMAAEFLQRSDDRISVDTATSASEGLDQLWENRYDCVVSDYNLPGQNGIDFLETVREDFPDLPFILNTGKGTEDIASHAISAGVMDYFRKESGTSQFDGLANRIINSVEKYRAQNDLRETSRRLQLALDATNTGVWDWNMETDEVTWSDSLERLLGIEPGGFGGTYEANAEYLHPDDVSTVEQSIEEALENDGTFHAEFRMVREDGERIWVEGRGELVHEDGTRRMFGTTTDITYRKESERELARREFLDPSVILQFRSQQIAQTVLERTNSELEFSLDGVVSQSDGRQRIYCDVTGTPPKEIKAGMEAIQTVETTRLLSTVGETSHIEVTTTPESIGSLFDEFDGEFQAFTIENGTAKVVGEFSETVDPEAVTRGLRDVYPDIELASQHRIVTPSFLRGMMEDDLTERQQSVLRMAYYSGYFDLPRQSTGDELADRLGITRQSFNQHLRKAMATVFHKLFEEAVEPPG